MRGGPQSGGGAPRFLSPVRGGGGGPPGGNGAGGAGRGGAAGGGRGSRPPARRGDRPRRPRRGTVRAGNEAGGDAAALECLDLKEWISGGRRARVPPSETTYARGAPLVERSPG